MARAAARRTGRRGAAIVAAAITAALAVTFLAARDRPALRNLEAQTLDLRFQLRGPIAPGPDIAILAVDDATIAGFGRWPLSRRLLAETVERLRAEGARLIVFSLLFAEPEPPSAAAAEAALAAALERGADDPGAIAARFRGRLAETEPDALLARAIGARPDVLVPYGFVLDRREANVPGLPPAIAAGAFPVWRAPRGRLPAFALEPAGVLAPVAAIGRAAAALGHVTVAYDTDGTLRYGYPVLGFAGELFPSLPVQAARIALGVPLDDTVVVLGEGIRLGDRFVPTDAAMRLLVDQYGPAGTFPTWSMADLLRDRLPPGVLDGRIVLVGGTAVGVRDGAATPFSRALPGVERHAAILDSILHDRLLARPAWTAAADLGAIVALGGVSGALATALTLPWAGIAMLLLLSGWSALVQLAFAAGGLWLSYVFPTAAIVLVFAGVAVWRLVREERRRRLAERHRTNLARYFSPRVLDELADRDRPFAFDRAQDAAVLFVDIVGFTRLAETLSPAAAMELLRQFHGRVERAVFAHDGSLDKFLGDGALAVFGMPQPGPSDARDALAAARRLADDMAAWGRERAAAGEAPVRIGIGVHHGPVLMGDIGGERRFEFTAIGDTVNVASRLEGLTRALDVTIVASDAAVAAARVSGAGNELLAGFALLPAQPLRGRAAGIPVWTWPAPADGAAKGAAAFGPPITTP